MAAPTVKFSVGGSYGKLICRPSAGTIDEPSAAGGALTSSERKVLDTLREEFPSPARDETPETAQISRILLDLTRSQTGLRRRV